MPAMPPQPPQLPDFAHRPGLVASDYCYSQVFIAVLRYRLQWTKSSVDITYHIHR